MRTRLVLALTALGVSVGLTATAFAAAPHATVPPACVLASGPNGLTLQAGYAPDGPGDCQPLP